jgi:hypothetical protein
MLTEDHLMRMLRLSVAALARVIGLKAALLHEDALYVVDRSLDEIFGLRPDLIDRLPDETLIDALTYRDLLDTDRLLVVADLFRERGELLTKLVDGEKGYWSLLRALHFYLVVVLDGGPQHFPPPHEKIDAVLGNLGNFKIPPQVGLTLSRYYESVGRYAEAEKTLINLIQQWEGDKEGDYEREAFYRRLLNLTDLQLEAGHLSRSYIEDQLKNITTSHRDLER